jgi:chitin synthase
MASSSSLMNIPATADAMVTDLCDLFSNSTATPTAESIAAVLRQRFLNDSTYTALSPYVLVSLNPYKNNPADSDATLAEYSADYRSLVHPRTPLLPHIFQLASRAYFHLRRTSSDQSIIFAGLSGSGKSHAVRTGLRTLLDLATPSTGKRGAKLRQQIPAAEFILESFGCATTRVNDNASRAARYIEIQFSSSGRIVGYKGLDYHLDQSRVAGPRSTGERNFHIFHYLIAGATDDERAHLRLQSNNPGVFSYLGTSIVNNSDATMLAHLKGAFKNVGFPKKALMGVFSVLGAIVHLGQIEFTTTSKPDAVAPTVVSTREELELVAELLGVSPDALESGLVQSLKVVGGERCTVFLDAEGAREARDDLARGLYGLLYAWISEYLNQKLSRNDFSTLISLLDLPGTSTNSQTASLSTFCHNLFSERVRAFTVGHLFIAQKEEYIAENVAPLLPGLSTSPFSNEECVHILTNPRGGLVHIIDDQTRKGKSNGSMLQAMGKRWGQHASFGWREGDEANGRTGTFVVSHWDGQVTYSVEGFLEANATVSSVTPDWVQLFGGILEGSDSNMSQNKAFGAGTPKERAPPADTVDKLVGGSSSAFVKSLFAAEALDLGQQALKGVTTIEAVVGAGPKRAPSTRRKKDGAATTTTDEKTTDKGGSDSKKEKDKRPGLAGAFNDSVTVLLDTLAETKPWHVFCIRPNDSGLANQVDAKVVRRQVGNLGLAELARRMEGVWSVRLGHQEWWERYAVEGVIAPLDDARSKAVNFNWRDKLVAAKDVLGETSDRGMAIGKTKVYLGENTFRFLEDQLRGADETEMKQIRERERQDAAGIPSADPFASYHGESSSTSLVGIAYDDGASSSAALPLVPHHTGGRMDSQYGYGGDDGDDDAKTFLSGGGRYDDVKSLANSDAYGNVFRVADRPGAGGGAGSGPGEKAGADETAEEIHTTSKRKKWVALTWLLTWWVPGFLLSLLGRMKRKDVRMAWREKVCVAILGFGSGLLNRVCGGAQLAINMIIWLLCAAVVFVIAILGDRALLFCAPASLARE